MNHTASPSRYDQMTCRRCGKSGLKLPAVSLGLWHNFGGLDAHENSLAWVLSRPAVTTVLLGASKPAQIEENVAALANLEFSPDELAAIDAACLL
ncbi:MAG: aldo/keto reductase [Verrucomicrobia bacterium]|nr:aldo/keto reductase [Verrucomicrobiota bacterium]